jgi:predicted  nucleic acid-binding Zn-ribbon protein
MDDSEKTQLDEIHSEVKDSHAQLGAINERTRNIERQLDVVSSNVADNEADINDLEGRVKRNTTIVGGFTGGISMILLWLSDKVTRLL